MAADDVRSKFATKSIVLQHLTFLYRSVTNGSKIHAERIVAFQLQQCLRERSTALHYTNAAYLTLFLFRLGETVIVKVRTL
jgi:hypothetical protein